MEDQKKSRTTRNRRTKRVPFGRPRLKMSLDDKLMRRLEKANLVPRWINDDNHGQVLAQAQDGGYLFVTSDGSEFIGEELDTPDKDRRIKKFVGSERSGEPITAYLMAIPKKFYEEDLQSKEEQNLMVDAAVKGGNPSGLKSHDVSPELGGTSVKEIKYKP